jgi:hypothetical protein
MNKTDDRRQRTAAQKAQTKAARLARADTYRRKQRWTAAALAASEAGYPLNFMITLSWPKIEDGDRRRGHILAKSIVERETHLWSELRQVAARAGVAWIAARAPEYDKTRGHVGKRRLVTAAAYGDGGRIGVRTGGLRGKGYRQGKSRRPAPAK